MIEYYYDDPEGYVKQYVYAALDEYNDVENMFDKERWKSLRVELTERLLSKHWDYYDRAARIWSNAPDDEYNYYNVISWGVGSKWLPELDSRDM